MENDRVDGSSIEVTVEARWFLRYLYFIYGVELFGVELFGVEIAYMPFGGDRNIWYP